MLGRRRRRPGRAPATCYAAATPTPAPVDPSLLAAVGRDRRRHRRRRADFDAFLDRFQDAATPQEELRFLYALADFDDPSSIDRLLAMTLTDEVRTQNAPYLLRRAWRNRDHGRAGLGVRARRLGRASTSGSRRNSIVRMLEGVRVAVRARRRPRRCSPSSRTTRCPRATRPLAQHLERLEVNVALRARDRRGRWPTTSPADRE